MEHQSNQKARIIISVFILFAIALIGFGLYKSQRADVTASPQSEEFSEVPDEERYAEIVNVKHQYKGGKHTYIGELNLPTPCHLIQSDVVRDETNIRKIEINFRSALEDNALCAQVITPRPFKVTFEAPEKITLTVMFDGRPIRFNIFEVPAEDNVEQFDINIKG